MFLWTGEADEITDSDEMCWHCDKQLATHRDQAGEFWCEQCLEQSRAGLLGLVSGCLEAEQRRQAHTHTTPNEVVTWWQRGLLSDVEALHYCVAGAERARDELVSIITEATNGSL